MGKSTLLRDVADVPGKKLQIDTYRSNIYLLCAEVSSNELELLAKKLHFYIIMEIGITTWFGFT